MPAALLDTNGVSDLMRDHPRVKARIATHPHPIATSVVAVGEIRYGLDRLPLGKKRTDLEARANQAAGLCEVLRACSVCGLCARRVKLASIYVCPGCAIDYRIRCSR